MDNICTTVQEFTYARSSLISTTSLTSPLNSVCHMYSRVAHRRVILDLSNLFIFNLDKGLTSFLKYFTTSSNSFYKIKPSEVKHKGREKMVFEFIPFFSRFWFSSQVKRVNISMRVNHLRTLLQKWGRLTRPTSDEITNKKVKKENVCKGMH